MREQQLRAYVEYFRDMGIHDFYRRGEPVAIEAVERLPRDAVEPLPVCFAKLRQFPLSVPADSCTSSSRWFSGACYSQAD